MVHPLDRIVLHDLPSPLAELHSTLGVDLEPHGDDRLQVVMLNVVLLAVGSRY